nr:GGDEF domain-containing protein [bacterium]
HQQGDIVLQHLAKILHNSTRIIDFRLSDRRSDIVARYGGEEFAVILPLTDIKGAKAVAERIRANVQEYEFPGQDKPLRVTVSLGLAEYKQGLTQVQLIKNADVALYQSKENGRNRISEFI